MLGGDFTWSAQSNSWVTARLSGNQWQQVRADEARRFLVNSYRVLLTRAREGLILWVPEGDGSDHTRSPKLLDETAEFLRQCGAKPL